VQLIIVSRPKGNSSTVTVGGLLSIIAPTIRVLRVPAWGPGGLSLSKDRKFQIVNSKAKIHSHRLPNHAPNQGKSSIITNQ
jgi:hypothetical protein